MSQKEHDARIDLAYALAEYIAKHPSEQYLPYRVAALTGKNFDGDLDVLVTEVEYWLDVLKKDAHAG